MDEEFYNYCKNLDTLVEYDKITEFLDAGGNVDYNNGEFILETNQLEGGILKDFFIDVTIFFFICKNVSIYANDYLEEGEKSLHIFELCIPHILFKDNEYGFTVLCKYADLERIHLDTFILFLKNRFRINS
jgi:hypothetical protein